MCTQGDPNIHNNNNNNNNNNKKNEKAASAQKIFGQVVDRFP
jgi:hypothetical protein